MKTTTTAKLSTSTTAAKTKTRLCAVAFGVCAAFASAQAQSVRLDPWMAAPNAAQRFQHLATRFSSVNQHLCASLSALCYPDLVGVPGYINGNSAHEAAYRQNLDAVLRSGSARYRRLGNRAGWGFSRLTHIFDAAKDAEGFIASNNAYAVISVRGSESGDARSFFKDWIEADLNMVPYSLGGGKIVHLGFWLHAKAIVAHAVSQLRRSHGFNRYMYSYRNGRFYRSPNPFANRPIWLTGHSLGGAAAILAAYILRVDYGLNVKGVYTVGQPTCGNALFGNDFLARGMQLHRAVNCSDFVARCFEDLDDLHLEHSLIQARVAAKISDRWPWPFDLFLKGLIVKFFSPSVLAGAGLAMMGKASAGVGFSAKHFGTLTYFDRSGVHRPNWNSVQRLHDRVILHSDDFLDALDPFLFPKPPAPWASWSTWSSYNARLANQKDKIRDAIRKPGTTFNKFTASMYRPFAQHGAHPQYLRLIFDRTRDAGVNMSGLPRRPE